MFKVADFDNFIFDLDGTLVNTSPRIIECLQKILRINSYESAMQRCSSILIGPPFDVQIKSLLPDCQEKEIYRLIAEFRKEYNKKPYINSKCYPYSKALLQKLSFLKKNLFLATNKPLEATQKIATHFFKTNFKAIYTPDCKNNLILTKSQMLENILLKYNLTRSKTVFVGDTESDFKAAKSIKIPFALVLFGYAINKTELAKYADFTINNYKELL